MAGQKVARQGQEIIEVLGGEEMIGEMILAGQSVREMCAFLGISSMGYYRWLRADHGRAERIQGVRKLRAEMLDDEGMDIVDALVEGGRIPEKEEVAAAKLRVEQRRHKASQVDPERRNQQAAVTINVESMYLEALKRYGRVEVQPGRGGGDGDGG